MSRGDTSPGSRQSQQTNIDTAVLFYHSHSVAELVCSSAEICWEWIRLINGSRRVTDEQYRGRARRGQSGPGPGLVDIRNTHVTETTQTVTLGLSCLCGVWLWVVVTPSLKHRYYIYPKRHIPRNDHIYYYLGFCDKGFFWNLGAPVHFQVLRHV